MLILRRILSAAARPGWTQRRTGDLGLNLAPRAANHQAMLDGVGYEIKLVSCHGSGRRTIRELRAFWRRRLARHWLLGNQADIYGRPVLAMDVAEAPCLGVAILAGAATETFDDVAQGHARDGAGRPAIRTGRGHARPIHGEIPVIRPGLPALSTLNHQLAGKRIFSAFTVTSLPRAEVPCWQRVDARLRGMTLARAAHSAPMAWIRLLLGMTLEWLRRTQKSGSLLHAP